MAFQSECKRTKCKGLDDHNANNKRSHVFMDPSNHTINPESIRVVKSNAITEQGKRTINVRSQSNQIQYNLVRGVQSNNQLQSPNPSVASPKSKIQYKQEDGTLYTDEQLTGMCERIWKGLDLVRCCHVLHVLDLSHAR